MGTEYHLVEYEYPVVSYFGCVPVDDDDFYHWDDLWNAFPFDARATAAETFVVRGFVRRVWDRLIYGNYWHY